MSLITVEEFVQLAPKAKNPDKWVAAINSVLPSYNITRGNRLAMFIAQCGHESAGFTVMQENLNYSADGLRKIFGKYFPTMELAQQYARQPEKIANRVYANRMGNGDESSVMGGSIAADAVFKSQANQTIQTCPITSGMIRQF